MTNKSAEELYALLQENEAKTKYHETRAFDLRKEWRKLHNLMAARVAAERYNGLKVGDVIAVKQQRAMRDPKEFSMRVDRFGADKPDDKSPTIYGTLVKKDGTMGTKKCSVFPSLGETWELVKAGAEGGE